MATPTTAKRGVTLDEFLRMPEIEEPPGQEFVDGRIEVKPMANRTHARIARGFDQRLSHPSRLPLIHRNDAREILSLKLPVEKNMVENQLCLFMHSLEANFVVSPTHDARAKLPGPHQGFHKFDLVETNIQEEVTELR